MKRMIIEYKLIINFLLYTYKLFYYKTLLKIIIKKRNKEFLNNIYYDLDYILVYSYIYIYILNIARK